LLVFPVFFGVAVLFEPLINALYGEKWSSAAAILMPLAIAMPFHAIMAVSGSILWGRGKAGKEMRVQVFVAILLVIVLAAMVNLTPVWMAWGVAGVYVFRAICMQIQVARVLKLSFGSVLLSIIPGLIVGSALASLFFIVDNYLMNASYTPLYRLLFVGLLGCLSAGLLFSFIRLLLPFSIKTPLSQRNDLPILMRRILRLA